MFVGSSRLDKDSVIFDAIRVVRDLKTIGVLDRMA